MAYVMSPWPVPDFDGRLFNDNASTGGSGIELGGREVIAIHLAIKQRADAVNHTITSGDFSAVWDGSRVWLSDPVEGDGRLYLRDVLQGFYDGVVDLVESGLFYEESGGDTAWSVANLVTDIGLGDWADLLTRPADPRPFQWLHAALDRLIYARVDFGAPVASQRVTESSLVYYATLQGAWDALLALAPHGYGAGSFIAQLAWLVDAIAGPNYAANGYTGIKFPVNLSAYAGDSVGESYQVARLNESGLDVDYSFGSAADTVASGTSDTVWLDSSTPDTVPGSSTLVEAVFSTALPATVPFAAAPKSVTLQITGLRVYLDLSSALGDQ